MLASLILYLKGVRVVMLELSGIYCNSRIRDGYKQAPKEAPLRPKSCYSGLNA